MYVVMPSIPVFMLYLIILDSYHITTRASLSSPLTQPGELLPVVPYNCINSLYNAHLRVHCQYYYVYFYFTCITVSQDITFTNNIKMDDNPAYNPLNYGEWLTCTVNIIKFDSVVCAYAIYISVYFCLCLIGAAVFVVMFNLCLFQFRHLLL